jgi:ribosomal protein S18 acetylase RimI-like enzyme
MTSLSVLPVADDDLPFVRAMLFEAAYWRGTSGAPPIDEALREPTLAAYVDGWGRPGDAGLVARVDGAPAGAVWVRRFSDDDPGYGYVDERTPELTIGVASARRGCGIGRCLVAAMLVQLRLDGAAQVSLSVETDNDPAVSVYERLGFVRRAEDGGAFTMVRRLR